MKYIDDIIEFNSILDNKSSNILSMEDFNDLQILESSGSIFNNYCNLRVTNKSLFFVIFSV